MIAYPRILLLIIHSCIAYTLGIMVSFLKPFNPWGIRKTAFLLCRPGMKILGIEYEQRNMEKLHDNLPCIIISNHQNNLDMFPCGAAIPPGMVALGKTSIIFVPFFGLFFWITGNIFINRSNKHKAKKSMQKVTEEIQKNKKSIWIMPEGTRSRGREVLLPFKRGAFITAINAGVPIVPLCLSSYHNRMKWNEWKSGKIILEALDPISTEGKTPDDAKELMYQAHEMMKKKIMELNDEVFGPSWKDGMNV